jgi:uncharacterized membrane protein YebE (DUF533 family)
LTGKAYPQTKDIPPEKWENPQEKTALLIDMVSMAKTDGSIGNEELQYIKEIGRKLKLSDSEINELITDDW